MLINFEDERPIFVQIAEGIEDAILAGAFLEESQIPSTTEISVSYKINPATALKGINLLVDSGILYKKRGVGMFVAPRATKKLIEKRRNLFYENYITRLIDEAKRLGIAQTEITAMIERGYRQ
ncbi:MAG TPA: GntR family transcriptional regulator [Firmicutes bacterium]|nr:GntR family transcriptional regulator [Bacillota bacterium]